MNRTAPRVHVNEASCQAVETSCLCNCFCFVSQDPCENFLSALLIKYIYIYSTPFFFFLYLHFHSFCTTLFVQTEQFGYIFKTHMLRLQYHMVSQCAHSFLPLLLGFNYAWGFSGKMKPLAYLTVRWCVFSSPCPWPEKVSWLIINSRSL